MFENVRIILWDVDGTLLDSQKRLSEVNRQALAAAAEIVCPHAPDADETIRFDGKDEFFN